MYSIRNVFSQEPVTISAAILAIVNAVLLWAGFVDITAEQLAATDTALVLVLGLFYARPLMVSKSALRALAPPRKKR